jgi:hypothetical protein
MKSQKIKPISATLCAIMTLIILPYNIFAQSQATKPPTTPIENLDCQVIIKEKIGTKEKEFIEFLEKHFQNKSDTSLLIDQAMEKFRLIRRDLDTAMQKSIQTKSGNISTISAQITSCQAMLNNSFGLMEAALRKKILLNSQVKKTTRLTEKLQHLNKGLKDMHSELSKTVGYHQSFEQKLPCFISKCAK